jgi:hypothetical protein
VFAGICAVPGLILFLVKQIALILRYLFELHRNQALDLKCPASVSEK